MSSVYKSDPDLIKKLFLTQNYSEEGLYRLRLCKAGLWEEVVIDDFIPCYPNGVPIFSFSTDPNEIWLHLLQKAYAKLHLGYVSLVTVASHQELL